ncbi:hypothetical protein JCM21142_93340 [Saccharicrinis fermentans DSM 9555 = JCM 21142]|uniref:Uncharacterized protein n=1 Tax=Saccharicrinis fermentans DSM 9555 = JCM 21142 TaxID=869213 RepID=W7YAN3_9BACT|nr:hypothetical protein JCM21142_93340 [Saccharicrinis fermentans DSM 9555 = JCM 21142]
MAGNMGLVGWILIYKKNLLQAVVSACVLGLANVLFVRLAFKGLYYVISVFLHEL